MDVPTLSDRTLTITAADPRLLYGFNDAYLRRVEAAFPDIRIVARGNELRLRGPDDQLDTLEEVVGELSRLLERNGSLTENDVETVLDLAQTVGDAASSGGSQKETAVGNVLLHTPSGDVVKARTPGQEKLVVLSKEHDIVFAIGPAGTGKTYTAVTLAVAALKERRVKKIVLCRPAVEAGESLGFLPGDFREKVDPYLRPLYDALEDMIERHKLMGYLEQNVVEIVPLAYMRGRTLNGSFVILDEAQNATKGQMKMFLTRLGAGSRSIVTGDITQSDLPKSNLSGLIHARRVLRNVDDISFVDFTRADVVRHKLVKDIIAAYETEEERDKQ